MEARGSSGRWYGGLAGIVGPRRLLSRSTCPLSALAAKLDAVLTVYLDQNKWIDLARAETGHPLGAPCSEGG